MMVFVLEVKSILKNTLIIVAQSSYQEAPNSPSKEANHSQQQELLSEQMEGKKKINR